MSIPFCCPGTGEPNGIFISAWINSIQRLTQTNPHMRKIIFFFLLSLFALDLSACTTFFINSRGQLVFGRNYDWVTDVGMVYTNQRGLSKTSMKTGEGSPISWVSRYGSITFNQYGKEFPTGGMNEKGLVVELMWLDETRYPNPDERPAIGVLQWIQYQLDNCATIDEVIATDKKLRIYSAGSTPLHYLVADAAGNVATIEWLDGKLVVHKGTDLPQPVLTNTAYKESLSYYRNTRKGTGTSFEYGNNSLQRFGQACRMINEYKNNNISTSPVEYGFEMLSALAQGDATKWSIVYDLTSKTIYFKTNRFQDQKKLSFSAFDFDCSATGKSWDMNQPANGEISHAFDLFSSEKNQKLIEKAFTESAPNVAVDRSIRGAIAAYPAQIACK